MEQLILKAEKRNLQPKGTNRHLRQNGKIPAVVYGGKGESFSIAIGEKEFQNATHTHAGINVLIRLMHPEGTDLVILKSIHRHPVTHKTIHVDFQRISLKETLELKIPVHLKGEAPGVKLHGGVLEHILREISIKCLPTHIPDFLEVDISQLEIGHGVTVKDLQKPKGVEILENPDQFVVNVVSSTKVEEVAPAAAPGVETAEPEVISRGKKEEAGAEGEKAAAPGAEPRGPGSARGAAATPADKAQTATPKPSPAPAKEKSAPAANRG